MTIAELRHWAADPTRVGDPVAQATGDLLRELDEQRAHNVRLAGMVPEYERMRTDLAIAQAANAAYSKKFVELRRAMATRPPTRS